MKFECINNIANSTDINELKQLFNDLAYILNSNCDKQIEKTIISKMRKEINNYKNEFKNKYTEINNLYIYSQERPFLYFYTMIIRLEKEVKNNFNLLDCINTCIEILEELDLNRNEHIPFDKQIEILYMADEKFKLFSLLNCTDSSFHLYNFPCMFNEDSCDIIVTENTKKTIVDLLLFDQKVPDRNICYLYATLLGRILNFILINNLNEAPYGMTRFLKEINIKYVNASKNEAPIIFSQIFAVYLLYGSKYQNILNEIEIELAPQITKYVQNVINTFRNDKNTTEAIEIADNELCPCKSGKIYKKCCKKKQFKWVKKDKLISRQVPVHKEVIIGIKKFKQETEGILERKLYPHEKVFRFISGPDLNKNEIVKLGRTVGVSEDLLYASYKTGLILSEYNINLLPDYEYANWKKALKEYKQLTKNNKDGINYIECIKILNKQLKDTWEKYLNESFSILNVFINDIKEDYFEYLNFEINDINDFVIFCVRRVIKNGQALLHTLQNNHYEVSMSIIRMLYEDLININVYINNEEIFKKHIEPLILIEKGTYVRLTDEKGNVSNKTAINPKTNERINYSINLKELSKNSKKEYQLLYDELFRDLSAYTHLNLTVKDTYFSNPDPFFEIERTNVAGILGLFFINQIISELAQIPNISDFTYRDLLFFSDKIKEQLMPLFCFIKDINSKENNLYQILIDCISDYANLK